MTPDLWLVHDSLAFWGFIGSILLVIVACLFPGQVQSQGLWPSDPTKHILGIAIVAIVFPMQIIVECAVLRRKNKRLQHACGDKRRHKRCGQVHNNDDRESRNFLVYRSLNNIFETYEVRVSVKKVWLRLVQCCTYIYAKQVSIQLVCTVVGVFFMLCAIVHCCFGGHLRCLGHSQPPEAKHPCSRTAPRPCCCDGFRHRCHERLPNIVWQWSVLQQAALFRLLVVRAGQGVKRALVCSLRLHLFQE